MKVMLHACCGPCLLEPWDALSADHEVRVVYANPNIHPLAEYERRRDTLVDWAEARGVPVDESPYDPDAWDRAIAGLEDPSPQRCTACYRLRLGMTASHAAASGFDAVATTLTVSPWQDPQSIREAGEAACAEHGVAFMMSDFRDRYPEATRRSRELGMYRQNYCGCRYSEREAADEREIRRAQRRRAKD